MRSWTEKPSFRYACTRIMTLNHRRETFSVPLDAMSSEFPPLFFLPYSSAIPPTLFHFFLFLSFSLSLFLFFSFFLLHFLLLLFVLSRFSVDERKKKKKEGRQARGCFLQLGGGCQVDSSRGKL